MTRRNKDRRAPRPEAHRPSLRSRLGSLAVALSLSLPAPSWAQSAPERERAKLIAATCYTCHRAHADTPSAIPRLEGLGATRLRQLLRAYQQEQTQATVMHHISRALSDAEIRQVSELLD